MSDATRTSAVWGQRWLEAVERDPAFGDRALLVGERVARAHAHPDVRVAPGRAEVVVSAGPRREYHTTIRTVMLSDQDWERLFDRIGQSPIRSAALASGHLDPGVEAEALSLGIRLLPEPGEVSTSCECDGWAQPCKHVAAALFAVADAIDDDPLLLLTLRGRQRAEVIESIDRRKPATADSQERDEPGSLAWLRPEQPLPTALVTVTDPIEPGPTPSWGAPPSSAPFTATGLTLIGTDVIRRAARVLSGDAPTWLDLDPASDLARLASTFPASADRRRLADHTGLSVRELGARALAWERGGALGVRAQVHPIETVRVSPVAQLRRIDHDGAAVWFRFEKPSGRWQLVAGPGPEPEAFLSADPIEG